MKRHTDLVDRATFAYARWCRRTGHIFEQPAAGASTVHHAGGCVRIELRNGYRLLACYGWNGIRLSRKHL